MIRRYPERGSPIFTFCDERCLFAEKHVRRAIIIVPVNMRSSLVPARPPRRIRTPPALVGCSPAHSAHSFRIQYHQAADGYVQQHTGEEAKNRPVGSVRNGHDVVVPCPSGDAVGNCLGIFGVQLDRLLGPHRLQAGRRAGYGSPAAAPMRRCYRYQ